MKTLCVFIGLLLLSAVVVGVYFGGSELLSPSVHAAKAEKLEAEADDVRAETAHKERMREIELTLAEQRAATEREAFQARQARLLEIVQPLSITGAAVVSITVLMLTGTFCYHFATKSKGTRAQQTFTSSQRVHYSTSPASRSRPTAEVESKEAQPISLIDRTKVHADGISYDGFLAYVHEYLLHPNRTRVFYHTQISSEIEALYLTILTETGIIKWGKNGRSDWTLLPAIQCVDDLRRGVPPREFYRLVSSGEAFNTIEPVLLQNVVLHHEVSPTVFSS